MNIEKVHFLFLASTILGPVLEGISRGLALRALRGDGDFGGLHTDFIMFIC